MQAAQLLHGTRRDGHVVWAGVRQLPSETTGGSMRMCVNTRVDTCVDVCLDMCLDVCIGMGVDMCVHICTDMCYALGHAPGAKLLST